MGLRLKKHFLALIFTGKIQGSTVSLGGINFPGNHISQVGIRLKDKIR